MEVVSAIASLDLVGHVQGCELRLRVGGDRITRLIDKVNVILIGEVECAVTMTDRGKSDDMRAEFRDSRGQECRFEELKEQNVCEVFGARLQLEAVCCFAHWRHHGTSVGDQNIWLNVFGQKVFCASLTLAREFMSSSRSSR